MKESVSQRECKGWARVDRLPLLAKEFIPFMLKSSIKLIISIGKKKGNDYFYRKM